MLVYLLENGLILSFPQFTTICNQSSELKSSTQKAMLCDATGCYLMVTDDMRCYAMLSNAKQCLVMLHLTSI